MDTVRPLRRVRVSTGGPPMRTAASLAPIVTRYSQVSTSWRLRNFNKVIQTP